ncbi:MAG: hypothetical protein HYS22_04635 [Deltaproteobacteria bacterium]|nr:hypothetical protein [Deltaproteobacteria bacterium]
MRFRPFSPKVIHPRVIHPKVFFGFFGAILFLGSQTVFASPPIQIGYQGFIADDQGVLIDGPASFKFCIAGDAGKGAGSYLWCHDNRSGGVGEPTGAIDLDVKAGFFSVVMGDDAIPGMEELPSEIFDTEEQLYLCSWFKEENKPFEKLEPCQKFTYSAFAINTAGGGSGGGGARNGDLTVEEGNLILPKGTAYVSELFLGPGVPGTFAGRFFYDAAADQFKTCTRSGCDSIGGGSTNTSGFMRKNVNETSLGMITAGGFVTSGVVTTGALISGSLTNSGNLTVDTNTLKVDASNNRVGIGTATPSYPFHVTSLLTNTHLAYIDGTSVTTGNALTIQTDSSLTTGTALRILYDDANMADGENILEVINQDSLGNQTSRFAVREDGQVMINGTILSSTYSGTSAVIVSSGTGQDLTLDGGNGSVLVASGDTLTAGSGNWSINDLGNTSFNIMNTGTVQTGGTIRITSGGALQNITSLTTTGAISSSSTIATTSTNAAGGSANPLDITSTLGAFDGSDDYTALDLNLTNANHSGTGNTVQGLDISGITGDTEATETAIKVGAGWDAGLDLNQNTIVFEETDAGTETVTVQPPATVAGNVTLTLPSSTGTLALTTSNVSTATALAANGSNCAAGSYPLGVNASGAVESCTVADSVSSTTWGGDLTGTGSSPTVADNSIDGTDIALGSDAQGDVLYYDGTNWARLGAGTSGQFLKTNGAGANPGWATVSGTGTVTSVDSGGGLTGGAITGSGTLAVGAGTGIVVNADDVAVDVGTTADKIVQLNGSAQIPAVDGALLTAIRPGNIVNVTDTTSQSLTDANEVITDSNPSITPVSTASRILVMISVNIDSDNSDDEVNVFEVWRGGTGCNAGGATQVGGDLKTFTTNATEFRSTSAIFVDSPSTTNATTYRLCHSSDATGTVSNDTVTVSITLMEIL